MSMKDDKIPQHVAIIMDGNGRWARSRNLPRTSGHLEGVKRVEDAVAFASKKGIKVLTLYAFSTENWSRPAHEVNMLMSTFITVLNKKIKNLNENGIRIQFIGKRDGVPESVLKVIEKASTSTQKNKGLVLNIAFNYGGRQEILEAVKKIFQSVERHELNLADLSLESFGDFLYTKGLPDPDLLIRTSGEKRISNFLLWQLSYAEFYFTEKFWPDFNDEEFEKALTDFKSRDRRYGKVTVS